MVAPFGEQQAEAAQRGERRERHDEGRQAEPDDAEGMEAPDHRADRQRHEQREPDRRARLHEHGEHHARESEHGTHGKIDAAGDDDESLPHGDDRPERGLAHQVREVRRREEGGGADRQREPHQQQQAEQRQAEQRADPGPAPPCRRLADGRVAHAPIACARMSSIDASLWPYDATSRPRRNTCSRSASSYTSGR